MISTAASNILQTKLLTRCFGSLIAVNELSINVSANSASNAIYPIAIMPPWLQAVAKWNPLTYEVDALRALMLSHTPSVYGLGIDFLVLFGFLLVLVVIGGWLYPRVIR